MKHIIALWLPLVMMVTVPAALADTISGTGTAKGVGIPFPMPSRRQKSRVPLANRAPP